MRFLVTAGPTREPIDPVRFISNRSSGRMGYAVAAAAAGRGHDVVLVSGPVAVEPPAGVRVIPVVTAAQMLAAVREALPAADALIMAAAVADWRPAAPADHKLKKHGGRLTLDLEPTEDILRATRPLRAGMLTVGFAAETGDPEAEALRKLQAKGLDMVVANDVTRPGAGFEVETNAVTFVTADGVAWRSDIEPKTAIALRIVEWAEAERAERERRNV
jgi:phosphopantothenoylcysteine decarboxylase/phosphopantothenate--cysteine ligase